MLAMAKVYRAYTLDEIDQMRKDIATIMMNPFLTLGGTEMNMIIEDRLRTYMQAGIRPEDIHEKAKIAHKEYWTRMAPTHMCPDYV